MSPLISIQLQKSRLRDYISTLTEGTYPYEVAVAQLVSLNKQHSAISSRVPLAQPAQPKRLPTPIKCSMRAISNAHRQEKQDPWVWDSLTDNQARALETVQNQIREAFFTTAERHILKLIVLSGGLKKAMNNLGFAPLLLLPQFLREAQGKALFKTFTDKLLQ